MSSRFSLWSNQIQQSFWQTLQKSKHTKKDLNEKFRLLIVTQFFPPDYAATGQLIQELAQNLGQKDIHVNIFTGQPGYVFTKDQAPKVEVKSNLHIRRSKSMQICSKRIRAKALNGIIFTLRSTWYLLRNARHNNLILLTTAPPFLAIAGYIANLCFGSQYVCLIYDLYPDAVVELGVISQQNIITKLWRKLNSLVWKKSKKIIVLSETMKQRITILHPELAERISVIHNWANADWIVPISKQKNWFAQQHQLDRKFTVLYSGNMGRCHDLETILGAMKLLRDQPIQFVFIGAGAKHEICRQTVAELKLDNCTFLPYQDKKNLPYSLTACDLALVSIAPGLEGVVAPSKLYGIMAAGKAIAAICEPHSYLRQIIDDAGCGAYVDNNNSQDLATFILNLAIDPELANDLGRAGRNYMIGNFTPQIITRQYCEVFDVNTTEKDNSVPVIETTHLIKDTLTSKI